MRITVLLDAGPEMVPPGSVAVVVDVLRATTSLSVALQNGARGVIPVVSPEEAFAVRRGDADGLLCGERDGRKIPGFDLGNSPAEYDASRVAGRALIFASTNGSQAMIRARLARRLVLGAFVNGSAVVETVQGAEHVSIVCAGQLGRFCLEDAACAGWLCERLAERGARTEGVQAQWARTLAPRDRREIREAVQGSLHGRYLRALGAEYARDVDFCADLDRLDRAFEI